MELLLQAAGWLVGAAFTVGVGVATVRVAARTALARGSAAQKSADQAHRKIAATDRAAMATAIRLEERTSETHRRFDALDARLGAIDDKLDRILRDGCAHRGTCD